MKRYLLVGVTTHKRYAAYFSVLYACHLYLDKLAHHRSALGVSRLELLDPPNTALALRFGGRILTAGLTIVSTFEIFSKKKEIYFPTPSIGDPYLV